MSEAPGSAPQDDVGTLCARFAGELGVSSAVHGGDYIFHFLANHPSFANRSDAVRAYFYDGRRSAEMLRALLYEELGLPTGRRLAMLEFASGYGCVTRHLRQILPEVDVTSCDIHPQAIDFLRQELSATALLSKSVPEEFRADRKFDVVFALSFFSHMPEGTWGRWLRVLYDRVEPGGFLIFTTHGQASLHYFPVQQIPASGFLYAAMSEQGDLDTSEYGSSLVTRDYVTNAIRQRLGVEIALYREAFWWAHQDLYVIAKRQVNIRPGWLARWASACRRIFPR